MATSAAPIRNTKEYLSIGNLFPMYHVKTAAANFADIPANPDKVPTDFPLYKSLGSVWILPIAV